MLRKWIIQVILLLFLVSAVRASYQAEIKVILDPGELRILMFVPDGLEGYSGNLLSFLERNRLNFQVDELGYGDFIERVNSVLGGSYSGGEFYGIVLNSECTADVYRLGFFEEGRFVPYRYLSTIELCEVSHEVPEGMDMDLIRRLLQENVNKNVVDKIYSPIEFSIGNNMVVEVSEIYYDSFDIEGSRVDMHVFMKGSMHGVGVYVEDEVFTDGVVCEFINANISCEVDRAFYDLASKYGEGHGYCYLDATAKCHGYLEEDTDVAECVLKLQSPEIDLETKTIKGVAHITCSFDWYDVFDFSVDAPFEVRGY